MNLNANIHPAQLMPACRNNNILTLLQSFCQSIVGELWIYVPDMWISHTVLSIPRLLCREKKKTLVHTVCTCVEFQYWPTYYSVSRYFSLSAAQYRLMWQWFNTTCIILFQAVGELHRDRLHHSFSWNGWMSMSWVHFLAVSPIECG